MLGMMLEIDFWILLALFWVMLFWFCLYEHNSFFRTCTANFQGYRILLEIGFRDVLLYIGDQQVVRVEGYRQLTKWKREPIDIYGLLETKEDFYPVKGHIGFSLFRAPRVSIEVDGTVIGGDSE